VHYPRSSRFEVQLVLLPLLLSILLAVTPDPAMAQASPFMTGATSLQTNARIAREYLVALPVELSPQGRLGLVRSFSQELSDRYGFAVDFAIHAPRDFPGSDPRNFHAHLLTTTREVAIGGLGAKTTLDMNDDNRRKLGLEPAINELLHVRARWASATNEALQEARIAARVDHRSLEAQGIDREPRPQIPRAAFEMERHGYRSVVADRIREDYQARVQARLSKVAAKPQSLEEIRREARDNWLRMRQDRIQSRTQDPAESAASHTANKALDDGHEL
jgi:ATP-dependent exoDNAse (exonuclease V) alpha subunit